MTVPDLSEYEQRFRRFCEPYADRAGERRATVQLKIDHTFRVLELARRITADQGFDEGDAFLAHLAALFHDVGRFPQFERYGVFNDASSENHARLGVKTLLRHKMLRDLGNKEKRTVLGAVFLHNQRALASGLPPALDRVARVVRDADKVDIVPVMYAHLRPGAPTNKAVTMGLTPHPDNHTPELLEELRQRRIASYSLMRWHNDFKLLVMTWIYDINYPASLRLLREGGHLDELMDSLPPLPHFEAARAQIREDMHKRLSAPCR